MVVWCSQGSCTRDIWFLVVFMRQKNAATELIIYSKSSECALVEGMITYSWKNLLPDLHFFKVGTHIWGGGTLPFTRATSFVQQWCTWTWWKMTVSTSCSTLNHCLLYNITNTLVMSELTLKNSEVSIISEKTRESACAILPNKTLPNQLACTMEHHHKLDSRRVSCCLLSSSSFLVWHFPANIVCSECELWHIEVQC